MRKNGNVRLRLMRQCGDRDEGIRLRVERGIRAATQDGMLGESRYSGYAVDRYLLDEADRLARRTVLASMLEERTNFVSQARLRLAPAAAKDGFCVTRCWFGGIARFATGISVGATGRST